MNKQYHCFALSVIFILVATASLLSGQGYPYWSYLPEEDQSQYCVGDEYGIEAGWSDSENLPIIDLYKNGIIVNSQYDYVWYSGIEDEAGEVDFMAHSYEGSGLTNWIYYSLEIVERQEPSIGIEIYDNEGNYYFENSIGFAPEEDPEINLYLTADTDGEHMHGICAVVIKPDGSETVYEGITPSTEEPCYAYIIETITLDQNGLWQFYGIAQTGSQFRRDESTQSSRYEITVSGVQDNSPPTASVSVDGYSHGVAIVCENGGSATITVRYKGVDLSGNLRGIRPQSWNESSDFDGSGTFSTVSGMTAEIVRTYTLTENGDYYFRADVQNAILQTSDGWVSSEDFHIKIIPAPPPMLTFETISSDIYNDQSVTGSGWAADPQDGAPINRVEIWIDGGYRGNATLGGDRPDVQNVHGREDWRYSGFSFGIPAAGYSFAGHTIELHAYNNSGVLTTAAKTFNLNNRAPNITFSVNSETVPGGQEVTTSVPNGSTITFSVNASDTDGNYQRTRVWVKTSMADQWEEIYNSTESGGTFTYALDSIATYSFRARSQDHMGVESATALININSQNRPPGPATLTATKISMHAGEMTTLIATLADADGNLDRHGIWWDRGIPESSWIHPQVEWGEAPPDATGWSNISTQNLTPSNSGKSVIIANWTPSSNGTYRFHCAGGDSAGAWGGGAEIIIVVSNEPPDTEPPSVPEGLAVLNLSGHSATVTWNASTGSTWVAGYEIFQNGVSVGATNATSCVLTGLAPSTTYSITVRAMDANDRYSAQSAPLVFGTLPSALSVPALPSDWAVQHQLDVNDPLGDPDGDGLTNIAEFNLGKNPGSHDQGAGLQGDLIPTDWPVQSAGGQAVGTTAGEFSVDKNGAATYAIPIAVTPGTAGVEPKITLNYSSQAGAGIAGYGWSIGGLSAITRGPQTKRIDGQNRVMDFSVNDRFYLDGQRLVVINNGTYGHDSAEYRTEMESFVRVVSYGTKGNGPAWFKAWTKSGLIVEFGNTNDSVFCPQNQANPLSWAVSKISDTAGNYMAFHYEVDADNGQQVLTSIKYTGHDGDGTPSSPTVTPYASLNFEYEARSDALFGYMAGAKMRLMRRLKTIKSSYGTTVVRTYTLNYSDRAYYNRSMLDSITEAGMGGMAFHPLTFTYSNPTGGLSEASVAFHPPTFLALADNNGRMADQGVIFIDLNGDGRVDCVQKLGTNGNATNKAWLNTPEGWVEAAGINGQPDYRLPNPLTLSNNDRNATNPDTGVRFADFDGDSLIDVMDKSGNVYLNTGSGWVSSQRFSLPAPPFTPTVGTVSQYLFIRGMPEVLDLDGDGRVDVSAKSLYRFYKVFENNAQDTWLNHGGGTEDARGSAWTYAPQHTVSYVRGDAGTRYLDLNGDGLADVLYSCGSTRHAYIKTHGGWVDVPEYHLPVPLNSDTSLASSLGGEFVDLNGDGLPDFITFNCGVNYSQNAVYINTGKGWVDYTLGMSAPREFYFDHTPDGAVFVDINNDGLADFVPDVTPTHINKGSVMNAYSIWKDTSASGNTYRLPCNMIDSHPDYFSMSGFQFIDLNADGAVDFIRARKKNDSTNKGAHLNRRVNPDCLTSVANGLGVIVTVAYAPLTAPAPDGTDPFYEKSSGACFPEVDVMGPMYVVKTVSHEDGAGGGYNIDYRYGGLRTHVDYGNLGFRWMEATDSRTHIRTKTLFNQQYPFIGLPVGSITAQENESPISETATTYGYFSLNNGETVFPYAAETIQCTYELTGILTSEIVTSYTYDNHGNATEIVTDTSGGGDEYVKTVTSVYDNWVSTPSSDELGGWMLGRLLSSTVVTKAPGVPTQTRTSDFEYYTDTGQLWREIIESGEADTSPLKLMTTHCYDPFGNKITVTTTGAGLGSGRTVSTVYDANGRFPIKTTNVLGHEETYTHDPTLGVLLSTTGPNGLSTSWEYDAFARNVKETRANDTQSTVSYCWAGNGAPSGALYCVETRSTGAAPAVVFYDKMGRAISSWSVNPGGSDGAARIVTKETLYDSMGRAYATSLPHYKGTVAPGWSQVSYDILNRPVATSTPDDDASGGAVISTVEYDGLITRTTNPHMQVEEVTKNTQGQIIKRVNNATGTGPDKGEIHYTYDAYDNLLKTTVCRENGSPVETTFEYDNRGRKIQMTSPDMGTWTYAYNALGELVSQTDARNQVTIMTYDALGRLQTRNDLNTSDTVVCTTGWTYDDTVISGSKSIGKPSAILVQTTGKPDYKETFLYDDLGRQTHITRHIDGMDYVISQEYDSVGRPSVTVYPDGFRVRNVYNTLGFLKEVRADGGTIAFSNYKDVLSNHLFWQADSYAVNGAVESHTLGNGLVCDRVISPVTGRLRAIAAGIRGGTHAQYHTYGYDLLGQIIRRQDLTLGREETFAYDGLNRLTHYKAGPPFIMPDLNGMDSPPLLPFSKTVTQSYDALGNITAKSDFGTYSYGGAAGPHAVASVYDAATGATRDYTYDANGNMLSDADRGMEWTVFDQVEKITRGATWTKFHFGASRERIMQEHSDGAKTIYVGSLYEAVSGPDGFLEEKYHVYSPSGRVATRTVRSDALVETRYYHSDGIGSITAVSDEYGRIEKRFAFDPWGRRDLLLDFHTGEGGKVTRGFTDHEHLDDFGLIHMNGRVFDPVLGRFLSADPYVGDAGSSQAYNRYSYCDNNPLNSTDPSGYFKIDIESIVIVGIAIGVSYCTYGAASTVMYAWAAAALAGATGGFTGAYMSALSAGASDNAALKAGLKAGLIGAAVAAVSSGIGSYFDMKWGIWSNDYANWTGRTLAHAVVGGVSSEMDGGQFRHGFYSSALSNGVMHMGGVKGFMGGNQGGWYVAARTTIAALIGGTAAELSGGKFANGAWTSALQHLFNKEAHIDENKNDTKVDLAFYDNSLESRPITDGSREDFKAAAEARGKTAIPVESSGDIVSYFKNNPGKYLDIGFFGHGNSDGIYINGKLVSKRVIISMISGLQPKGELYLFACNVADAIGMNPPRIDSYSEYLNDGKVIWAHKGIINHVKWTITSPKGKVTIERHMRSDGYENLYMRKYIK